jgi:uncharacterized protein (DUF934 family)
VTVIVTDTGHRPGTPIEAKTLADLDHDTTAVDLSNTDDPSALADHLHRITLIRIAFPAFSDGRGFTLARRLRTMGYAGCLRAAGPVIADQYAMFRRSGFDEVEISDDMAARQPADQWQFRANWKEHDYQARLRA